MRLPGHNFIQFFFVDTSEHLVESLGEGDRDTTPGNALTLAR